MNQKITNYKVLVVFHGTIGRERKTKFQCLALPDTKSRELEEKDLEYYLILAREKIRSVNGKIPSGTFKITYAENVFDGIFNTTDLFPKMSLNYELKTT